MTIYNIKNDYIQFLRTFDTKIEENKNEKRPYVGVVLQIGSIEYYAPLTSPKPKHKNMKNSKDFRKIENGKYGAINFCNMIPVPRNALIWKDINNEPDLQYRRLLQNQYKALKADWNAIQKTAENLRNLIVTPDDKLGEFDRKVKSRCCDIVVLESVYTGYKK